MPGKQQVSQVNLSSVERLSSHVFP